MPTYRSFCPVLIALLVGGGIGRAADLSPALAARAAQVDRLFAAYQRPGSPGCAVAVIQEGAVVYQRGHGFANLDDSVPITPATVFNIGSVSKQFTVLAVLLLAKEGKLTLDDDVRKHLPELPDFGKPIAVRHLIHHTSGLREMVDLMRLAGWRMEDLITEREVLELVCRQKQLNFEPGRQYLYCNTGYLLLGQIVQRASGQSLRQYAQEKIFAPLGMASTHFHDDHRAIVPKRAGSYRPGTAGGFQHIARSADFAGPTNLYTTVEDLARWDRNFYDARVGGRAVIDQLLKKGKLNNGQELDYAGGLKIGEYRGLKTVEHGGVDAGYRAIVLRFPEQRFTVIALGNVSSFNSSAQARAIADLYLADKLKPAPAPKPPAGQAGLGEGEAPKPVAAEASAEKALTGFTGTFQSDELGVIYTVRVHDGKLVLRHPRGEEVLKPVGGDGFVMALGRVNFTRNGDKQVNGFLVSTARSRNLRFGRVEIKAVP